MFIYSCDKQYFELHCITDTHNNAIKNKNNHNNNKNSNKPTMIQAVFIIQTIIILHVNIFSLAAKSSV